MLKPRATLLNHTCLVINHSGNLYIISRSVLTKSQVLFVVHEGTKLHSGLTLVGTTQVQQPGPQAAISTVIQWHC